MKKLTEGLLLISLLLAVSCEKKARVAGGKEAAVPGAVVAVPEPLVVADLGFASRVSADSDFFFAAYYDGEKLMDDAKEWGLDSGVLLEGSMEPKRDPKDIEEDFKKAAGYLGSEVFVFSGPGVGDKLAMVGTSYRELSAAWTGFAVGALLDALAKEGEGPDMSKLGEGFSEDFLERWLSVIEKESKLLVPSVVAGWHPSEARREECMTEVGGMLDRIFKDEGGAKPVSFTSYGAEMVGYEVLGTEVFGEMIESMRKGIEEKAEEINYGDGLSAERLEQFLVALEDVKFTVAAGIVDGRILMYFGDGIGGFKLADSQDESLAAKEDMKWMAAPPGKRLVAAGYLSETMVGSVLPWLDTSPYWESIANAVRAPIAEQRLMQELLRGLATTAERLGQRDISAWSGAAYSGDGWSLRTRGGILDPSIDFEAPLKMMDAVSTMKPAFRGHWVQKRGWNDLAWKKTEYIGFILEAVKSEFQESLETQSEMLPGGSDMFAKMSSTIQDLNGAYRSEFRNGIGDEVAVFGDFLGEVPPIPGISEETVRDFTVPRIVYARPVVDRAMIAKSGESLVEIWKDSIAYANGLGEKDMGIPLILPQLIESDGLATWYAPLPFIGGDFVPGISIDDQTWMVGTSRSLAGGLAKGVRKGSGSVETGVFLEMDFDALELWLREAYENGKDDAKTIAEGELDAAEVKQVEKSAEFFFKELAKLKSLKYRHWLEAGKPRTSLDLEFD